MITVQKKNSLIDLFFKLSRSCHTLVECGAHRAEASVRFGRKAIAIEANPITFDEKMANAPHITRLNVALDKEEGTAYIHIFGEDQAPGNASTSERTDARAFSMMKVPATTLDKVTEKLDNGLALWIDVEGKSYEVLQGGLETLKKTDVLIIEVEEKQFWKNQKLDHEVKKFLEDRGFVYVARDQEYPQQYNMIYVKFEFLVEKSVDYTLDNLEKLA